MEDCVPLPRQGPKPAVRPDHGYPLLTVVYRGNSTVISHVGSAGSALMMVT